SEIRIPADDEVAHAVAVDVTRGGDRGAETMRPFQSEQHPTRPAGVHLGEAALIGVHSVRSDDPIRAAVEIDVTQPGCAPTESVVAVAGCEKGQDGRIPAGEDPHRADLLETAYVVPRWHVGDEEVGHAVPVRVPDRGDVHAEVARIAHLE